MLGEPLLWILCNPVVLFSLRSTSKDKNDGGSSSYRDFLFLIKVCNHQDLAFVIYAIFSCFFFENQHIILDLLYLMQRTRFIETVHEGAGSGYGVV